MSKYKDRGPYHLVEFSDPTTPYYRHVDDLTRVLVTILNNRNDHLLKIHEVGCGEGLILLRLWYLSDGNRIVNGNDPDEDACRFGRTLLPQGFISSDHDITRAKSYQADVVLFSDSLEHIPNWEAHVEWAKERAMVIAIAVPSALDKHAINFFSSNSFDRFFPKPWKNEVRSTRHYRHVTIWSKPDA